MTESTTVIEKPEIVDDSDDALLIVDTKNYFKELASIDVSGRIEKKNGFSYLSWAWATDLLKKLYTDSKINVKRFPEADQTGNVKYVPYLQTALGYFVEVEVIVGGVSVSEPFAVTDYRNKPIPKPTTFDINSSIQRAKVKAIAGHGLGLYIYAGEDVPAEIDELTKKDDNTSNEQQPSNTPNQQPNSKPTSIPLMDDNMKKTIVELATEITNLQHGDSKTEQEKEQLKQAIYTHYRIDNQTNKNYGIQVIQDLRGKIQTKRNEMASQGDNTATPKPSEPSEGRSMFSQSSDDLSSLI